MSPYPTLPDRFGKRPGIKPKAAHPPGLHLPEVDRLELRLADLPPSSNNMFVNGHGRHKSGPYKQWVTSAGWMLKPQMVGRVPGLVVLHMTFGRPTATSDLDNRIKPVCDLLVTNGLIDDDRFVQGISAWWGTAPGCQIVIERAA